jgi:predicted alpha/beta superfamily hydrolase
MRKLLLITLLCGLFSCTVYAQSFKKITIGIIDSIDSKILNENRKIWIYIPDDSPNNTYSKMDYPVVYLLDGDSHFYSVVGMIRQLSSINGNTVCPKMIVVGIPNTNRNRDLTPSKGDIDYPFVDSAMVANAGGGEKFMSFIEKELIPHIESNYPTNPYRMLIGHSIGGLTVMNTFVHHTTLFNAYVAIDPSMWWNKQKLLREFKNYSIEDEYDGVSLFLGIANTMEDGMDTLSVQKDTTLVTEHIRSILELDKYLRKNSQNKLNYQSNFYSNDSHGSVPLIAEYDALRFIFSFYQFKISLKEFLSSNGDVLDKIEDHYHRVSEKMGFIIKPDEALVNSLAYEYLSVQKFERAAQLFKLNIENYPESFSVYDSIGDLYSTMGEQDRAIENYKKSISLNENSSSKQKLEKLQKGQ